MSDPFFQTPAFQLNLILWLSWFSTSANTGIRPIFREYGFTLHAVERTFSLPQRKRQAFSRSNINVNTNTDPDVLLKHDSKPLLLPIECKSSSFGPASSNTKQAYTLLSISGTEMADQIGFPNSVNWGTMICYAVGDGNHDLMHTTLLNLSDKIKAIHIEPNASGSLGIEIDSTGIYIHIGNLFSDPEPEQERIQVKADNSHFIYLIPADLDESMDESGIEIRSLEERLRAAFMESVMERLTKSDFVVSEDDIMRKTIEVWSIWNKRQTKKGLLRRAVRPYLRKIVDELKKIKIGEDNVQIDVHIENREIRFSNISRTERKALIGYFTSPKFKDGDISFSQNMQQIDFGDYLPDNPDW